MTVSVIMALYNGAGYLGRAIASLQSQTFGDWELIVSDDASSDEGCAIVERMIAADGRIRLLRADRNAGPGAARNAAIGEAKGEWLAVLDADDAFRPTRLADMLAAADRTHADLVVDNLTMFDGRTGREDGLALDGEAGEQPLTAVTVLRAERPWPGPRLGFLKPLIRMTLVREHALRYPASLRHSEDLVLLVEAALVARSPTLLLKPGYIYTRPEPRPHATADASRAGFIVEQRAAAGRMLLERHGRHPDQRVRRALAAYAVWTRDIARGRKAVAALRERRPDAAARLLSVGTLALFRYLVTVPRVKRVLRAARLSRSSIG